MSEQEEALQTPETPRDVETDLEQHPSELAARPLGAWLRLATAIAAGLVLGMGTIAAIEALGRMIAVIFLGVTIAMALDPLVDRLQRGPLPRTLVVILIYAVLVGLIVLAGVLVVPLLADQVEDLINRVPGYVDTAEAWLNAQTWLLNLFGADSIGEIRPLEQFADALANIGQTLLAVPVTIVTAVTEFILMIFISIYWLVLTDQMMDFIASLFPERRGGQVLMVLRRMGNAMGGYLRGLLIDMTILGTLSYIGLLIIGVNYALVLGVLFGLGELVPVVGPFATGVVLVLVALFQSPQKGLITLAFVLLMQQFENNLLVPVVMKSQVHISPLLTLLAVAIGGVVGGLLGAIVALPVAAALNAFVEAALAPAIRRRTGAPPKQA